MQLPPKKHGSMPIAESWTLEVTLATLSLLSLAALAILLVVLDGKSTFDWHGITVNAVVSILSTTSRASLFAAVAQSVGQIKWIQFRRASRSISYFESMEMASRDMISQVSLLYRMPFGLASLGVAVLLLTLAFDPFAQQLVQTQAIVDFRNASSSASLPVALRFDSGTRFALQDATLSDCPIGIECNSTTLECNDLSTAGNNVMMTVADLGMQSAVLAGLNQQTTQGGILAGSLPFSCPSGNCTWDAVDSLAICSKCTDVSGELSRFDTDYNSDGTGLLYGAVETLNQWIYLDRSVGAVITGDSSAFVLPNGLYIENLNATNTSRAYQVYHSGTGRTQSTILMTSLGTGNASQTIASQDDDKLIWAMSFIHVPPSTTKLWPDVPLVAQECSLSYCVKTLKSNVTNGVLYEDELVTDSDRDPSSWQPVPRSMNSVQSAPELPSSEIQSLEYDPCLALTDRTDLIIGRNFSISQKAANSLSAYMESMFTAKHFIMLYPVNGTNYVRQVNGWVLVSDHSDWQPSTTTPLLDHANMTTTFASIAQSMTLALRSSSTARTSGRIGVVQIVVNVRWLWIILPALTVLAGMTQLAISIILTRSTGAPLYKSNLLAMLARGGDMVEALAPEQKIAGMNEIAKSTFVELFPEQKTSS